MEENKIPKLEMPPKNYQERYLITSIVLNNNKEYFLYNDGNLYERDNSGKLIKLDNITSESKELIKKIMQNFKSGKTDIYQPEKVSAVTKKQIEVEIPEL